MKRIIYSIVFCISSVALIAQNSALDQYIEQGIKTNLVLRQKELARQNAIARLKEARGLFLPEINLNARYTVSRGGRYFELPLGDMMNPVYQTLNEMTVLSCKLLIEEPFTGTSSSLPIKINTLSQKENEKQLP